MPADVAPAVSRELCASDRQRVGDRNHGLEWPIVHEYLLDSDPESAFVTYTTRIRDRWDPRSSANPATFESATIEPWISGRIYAVHEVAKDDLIGLYDSVGWEAYTRSPDTVAKAIENSNIGVTAGDQHGELIGLARGLSDGATIFYLQDILVRPEHQHSGVGRHLLTVCLERYSHVPQKVLLTDDDEAQQRFYESLGYVQTTDFTGAPLHAHVRFDTERAG